MSYLSDLLGGAYREGMTEEEISTAMETLKVGIPQDNTVEVDKLKAALSKANSQAADYKKQLRGKQSEDEAAAAEQKALMDKLTEENTSLKRSIALADTKTKLVGMGYDEKLADSTATAMLDGDMDTVMKNQMTYLDSQKKNFMADAMRKTPRPASGSDNVDSTQDYSKKIEQARANGSTAEVAYYTRLQEQEKSVNVAED